jgi:hypothetical protein
MISRVVFPGATMFLLFIHANVAYSQDPSGMPKILRLGNLKVLETDTALETLRKKSFNASRKEIHARINLWSQQIASIDGVIDSLERFHQLRMDVESMPDETEYASDRVETAKYLLRKCESLKPRRAVLKETDLIILTSYQLRCELEAELLKLGKK